MSEDVYELVDDDVPWTCPRGDFAAALSGKSLQEFEVVVDVEEAEPAVAVPVADAVRPATAAVAVGGGIAEPLSGGDLLHCDNCGALARPLRCSRCHTAVYCSMECQRAAWRAGHRNTCSGGKGMGAAPVPATAPAGAAPAAAEPARLPTSTVATEGVAGLEPDPMVDAASARLQREASVWHLPASPETAKHRAVAALHVQRTLPALLDAHAAGTWSEHHTSGLLDHVDLGLPARSGELSARLSERLFHCALGECLERVGQMDLACGAYGRAGLASHGCVEVYHRWADRLRREGREHDALAVHRLGVQRGVWQHVQQRPNDLYVPGLRAEPFWDPKEVSAVKVLEAAYPAILREYRSLREPWIDVTDKQLVAAGAWTDFKLIENGKRHAVNCARCPETLRLIEEHCPEIATQVRGSLIFSHIAGGTTITRHCGPTNARIRIHLGLEVPEPRAWLRVGSQWRTWKPGRCLIFDDSFEHEVLHRGDAPRAVLIADLWHPELTEQLRRKYLHGRHLRRYEAALAGNHEPHRVEEPELRFLEPLLRRLPEVREAVAALHEEEGRQTLLAYIECTAREPTAACDRCAELVKPYGMSSLVLAVREWPRTADGGVDRARLPPPPRKLLDGLL